jgi:preprotein translocase subunit SecY
MPSADNIGELVVFGLIASGVFIIILVGFRFTPAGKRAKEESENWQTHQNLTPQIRPREPYNDPVSKTAVRYSLVGFAVMVVLAFLYYFVIKGGFTPGN